MGAAAVPDVALRVAGAHDLPALQAFIGALSIGTRVRRFFAPVAELPPLLARAIADGDPQHHFVVAELTRGRDRSVAALAQLAFAPQGDSAELAVVVADPWQGRSIGWNLLQRLHAEARRLGVQRLEAETQRDNRPMLALLRRAGFAIGRHPQDGGLLHAQLDLAPVQVRERVAKKYFFWSAGVIANGAAENVAAKQVCPGR